MTCMTSRQKANAVHDFYNGLAYYNIVPVYGRKNIYTIGSWGPCYQTFFRPDFTNEPNKLECLALASISSL
jgi:hypothetical protein